MAPELAVIGAPSGAGPFGVGQEGAPAALRRAGLIDELGNAGFHVTNLGDSPVVPWHPDRVRPRAQNLEAVVDVVGETATRVADALAERGRTLLVLGGDCTVGIGTIDGVRSALGSVAVAYFDLHSDLNTPESATDGALDWMALLDFLAARSGRFALHLDLDVVDFTDAPLSEHPSRNAGLKLEEMRSALTVFASDPVWSRSR